MHMGEVCIRALWLQQSLSVQTKKVCRERVGVDACVTHRTLTQNTAVHAPNNDLFPILTKMQQFHNVFNTGLT